MSKFIPSSREWKHPEDLVPHLLRNYIPFESVLDVGGGPGHLASGKWGTDNVHILDIWEPATIPLNFTQGCALDAVAIYGPQAFDLVICSEVIEHLPKDKGPLLFEALEAVAKRIVIFTTPNGFTPQDPAASPSEPWSNNPYQKHLCGYSKFEFIERGYAVFMNPPTPEDGAQIIAIKDVRR